MIEMKPVSVENREYYDLNDSAQEASFRVPGWSCLLLLDENGLWGLLKPEDGVGTWAADLAWSRRAGERLIALPEFNEDSVFQMISEQGEAA